MNDREEYIAYIRGRKSSDKVNYHLQAVKEMTRLRQENRKPSILLHACCVVCACWPMDFLSDVFDVTLIYNNSNIYPFGEYNLRLSELKRYLKERWNDQIRLIVMPYDNETYNLSLQERKDDPEGWKRCFACYEKRMDECFRYADENGYDYFTTVMTFSRQKDSQILNQIGLRLQEKYTHTRYFCSDFKKADGQKKANAICDAYDLYRQDYCGCIYSYAARQKQKQTEADNGKETV
jgi:predicted adenine nucleotide alpha hydrolase (AANH) superfamily ATPase